MRLVSLKVSGYRQFLDQITLQIPPGLNGICGPNGVGKSKLIEAIGYALYGPASAVTQKVIELLRLTADAFCGTFVARQNEVAGLQSIDPNRRRRIVNRLIGIAQVEQAIHLAREIKASRDHTLDIAQAKLQKSSAEAQQQLDVQQAERDASIEARKAQEQEVEALARELQAALAQSDALERRQEQVAQYQEMIEQLAPAETSAINRVRLAKERLETAQAAAHALA